MKDSRKELRAALIWIAIYVVGMSVGETLNAQLGSQAVVTAPLGLALCAALCLYLRRTDGWARYGFVSPGRLPLGRLLFCLPMLALMTVNLWRGVVIRFSPAEMLLYVLFMLCTGFLEETLFRGFLLRALMRDGTRSAILVSSLTFGLGHIVNLLNGEELLPTLLQLVYAVAIGLMLSVFVVKTGRLVPCIVFHSVFNALSAFSNEAGLTTGERILISAVITLVAVGYAACLWFRLPDPVAEKS